MKQETANWDKELAEGLEVTGQGDQEWNLGRNKDERLVASK